MMETKTYGRHGRAACRGRRLWAFCSAVSVVSVCFISPCTAGAAQKDKTPQVEKITDSLYRVGKAIVDTRARTVTCTGEINMDAGSIEYLAVTPNGKTHESLLRIDIRPLHLQVALLLLGLEAHNVLKVQGEKKTPEGDPTEILVRWKDRDGKTVEFRAEDLIQEMPKGRPMPRTQWVFTGSRILKEGFEADMSGSLVAVWHDPAALLDNPLPGGSNNAYVVNSKRTPKHGTAVEFVIKAVEKKPADKSARSARLSGAVSLFRGTSRVPSAVAALAFGSAAV